MCSIPSNQRRSGKDLRMGGCATANNEAGRQTGGASCLICSRCSGNAKHRDYATKKTNEMVARSVANRLCRFSQNPLREEFVRRVGVAAQTISSNDDSPFRGYRIVLRNRANNVLELFEGLRSENYFPAHPRIFSRTRSRGTPSPASSSAAALSSRASNAASSLLDISGSS